MFPRVALVEQSFPRPKIQSLAIAIIEPLKQGVIPLEKLQGKSIAVGVGSRGITNIAAITKTVIDGLKTVGANPFVFPCMGSHAGGTVEGQMHLLKEYGVTPETMGVPFKATMDTVEIEATDDGIPVYFDKYAFESDGIILVNRVKQHTDFEDIIESGLHKMTTIGLGKKVGAFACHSRSSLFPYGYVIRTVAERKLATGKILAGVAIIENAYNETAKIEIVPAEQFGTREPQLLNESKSLMPSLPIESADLLIVDEIGKNISGAGMDPKIIGRRTTINTRTQAKPDITRVVVRDLTQQTEGNAAGIGFADFCVQRVLDKLDRQSTYTNAITSRNIMGYVTPLHFPTDLETLEGAVTSLGMLVTKDNMKMLRIRNTLDLTKLWVSEPLLDEVKKNPNVCGVSDLFEVMFDENGTLQPLEAMASV